MNGRPDRRSTPVERHGALQIRETNLCDERGDPIQLTGMSSHGLQWFGHGNCLTDGSLDAVAEDWLADVFRISMYVHEEGFLTDPEGFTEQIHDLVEATTERGLYAIIDWHVLDPGDPRVVQDEAIEFFDEMARTYADHDNVLYEICNEPNGVRWDVVREYTNEVLPVIRSYDEDGIVLVGTCQWSSLGVSGFDDDHAAPIEDPIEDDQVAYTFHFYAGSHGQDYRDVVRSAADEIPLFVSEWGSQDHTGDGPNDFENARAWLDLFEEKAISWVNWNYSDDHRSGAVWQEGTCPDGPWSVENLKPAGKWVREQIRDSA